MINTEKNEILAANGTNKLISGNIIEGYIVKTVEQLPHIKGVFYGLEDPGTGARHIHIECEDNENTFGVAFRTIPKDSTGVAHILEHTVLCGSEKYPVRDPFFSMLKRSLSTFMNAFTASDWTMYPFSTQNRKDFDNLMDVYLDAAFFPKIDELSFKQEGCRLEYENCDDPESLSFKGVVFNEMKGAMSSQDQVLSRSLSKAIYPETEYSFNSGGDPKEIPLLRYEDLKAFHAKHYHPGNAFFYTYGNIPLSDHLKLIRDKILSRFQRSEPVAGIESQPRWSEPRIVKEFYPASADDDLEKKSQVCVAWLTSDIKDSFENLCLMLLGEILLGNSASPLRKALVDSGLGSAMTDATGFDPDHRDALFACGLKEVSENDADRILELVLDTLGALAGKGIDQELIDSSIHQLEFHRKEITNTPYPYGLKLLMAFSGVWLHDGDPLKVIKFEEDIAKIKQLCAEGNFFEGKIRKHLLDNKHRLLFILSPDTLMAERENNAISASLEKIKKSLNNEEIVRIKGDAEKLVKLQDSEENLECLPMLALSDIPSDISDVVPSAFWEMHSTICYHQPCSGIFYFTSAFGIGHLSEDLMPWVPFFCWCACRVGTKKRDYIDLARLMDAKTGGVSMSAHTRTGFDKDSACISFLTLTGKCLDANRDAMLSIISELTSLYSFNDLERLKTLIQEYRAALDTSIVRNGHRLAMSLASRNFSGSMMLGEIWHGIHQIKMIKDYCLDLDNDGLVQLSHKMAAIADSIFRKSNNKTAIIGSREIVEGAEFQINEFVSALSIKSTEFQVEEGFRYKCRLVVPSDRLFEGWQTNSSVAFVASCFPAVRLSHPDSPVFSVLAKLLKSLYLHREIREKGGAYGGFSLYNSEDGLFSFGSYRDPHISRTLDVYESSLGFIKQGDFSDSNIREAILQICSEIDKPDTPGPSARKAFYRRLVGLSREIRMEYKAKLLKVTKEDVIRVASEYLEKQKNMSSTAVISGKTLMETESVKMTRRLDVYTI